jgi:hypothetical protein
VDTRVAAQRWADVWERCWRAHDPEPVKTLYATGAAWSQHPFRPPDPAYVDRVFGEEEAAECEFEQPLVDGDRAAVAWRGRTTLVGGGTEDLVGVSLLRFDDEGLVVEQRDIWVDGS